MSTEPGVVLTAAGCVSPFGDGVERLWHGLFTGPAPQPPKGFPVEGFRAAGVLEVPGHDGPAHTRPVRLLRAAGREAIASAGLSDAQLQGAGLVLASTSAGWQLPDQAFAHAPLAHGPGPLRKEWPAAVLAGEWGLTGPCAVLSSACASSTGAIAWATERIRAGEAELMLVAAVDVITEVVFAGFHSMRLLTKRGARPFKADRDGFVLAEGAVMVVLESAEHAARRGGPTRAAVSGWGASADAVHLTTPSGEGIARALGSALADAGCTAADIGVYHAHGTASGASDRAEAEAVAKVLAPDAPGIPTTAIKGAMGHAEGAAGLFTLVAAVEALVRERLPPVLGEGEQDPATGSLALTTGQEPHPAGSVVVHASGFGGANCSAILGRTAGARPAPSPVPVVVVAAAGAGERGRSRHGWFPEFGLQAPALPGRLPTTPRPDHVCRLLAGSVGELLGGLPEARRAEFLAGGLLIGTEFGAQEHHRRMHAGLRERGARGVDPIDFALSTFNTPAAMASVAHGLTGRTETFLGATGAVEALVEAARSVACGRVPAVLAGGYDAPENRLRPAADDPVPAAGALVLALAPGSAPQSTDQRIAAEVEIAGSLRLPIASEPAGLAAIDAALGRLCARTPELLLASGLGSADRAPMRTAWVDGVARGEGVSAGGAVAALEVHLAAIRRIADGAVADAVVASTGPFSSTILVHYRRITDRNPS